MKSARQEKILELIKNQVCLTQEDLQNGLEELGFNVTQSTVSRDIRELKLVKGRDENGNYRYLSNPNNQNFQDSDARYHNLLSSTVKSVRYSINNVVIKCESGMASSACVAVDELYGDMMIGTLAGEDTIIIVTEGEEHSKQLTESLLNLL